MQNIILDASNKQDIEFWRLSEVARDFPYWVVLRYCRKIYNGRGVNRHAFWSPFGKKRQIQEHLFKQMAKRGTTSPRRDTNDGSLPVSLEMLFVF